MDPIQTTQVWITLAPPAGHLISVTDGDQPQNGDLIERSGPEGAARLVITLAGQHFAAHGSPASATNVPSAAGLDVPEPEHLEDIGR